MKLKDVKLGMKVVPFQKTCIPPLRDSSHWMRAIKNNQPYLFVNKIRDDKIIVLSEINDKHNGDFFYVEDFEPYIENREEESKMKKFDFEKYIKNTSNIAVHCKTVELANEFLRLCDKNGVKWSGGADLLSKNRWYNYEEQTCYTINNNKMTFTEKEWYEDEGYTILEFSKDEEDKLNNLIKDVLPSDVKAVYINDMNVTVVLNNGEKGTSKCYEYDEFDPYVGYCIAYHKAKNSKNFKLKKAFEYAIEDANEKGYKQTVLKND